MDLFCLNISNACAQKGDRMKYCSRSLTRRRLDGCMAGYDKSFYIRKSKIDRELAHKQPSPSSSSSPSCPGGKRAVETRIGKYYALGSRAKSVITP